MQFYRFPHWLCGLVAALTFTGILGAGAAHGDVIAGDELLIDFGQSSQTSGSAGVAASDGRFWNNVAANANTFIDPSTSTALVGDLVRSSDGAATGVSIFFINRQGQGASSKIGDTDNTESGTGNDYPESARRDAMVYRADFYTGTVFDFEIRGLDPNLTYDLSFFGSIPTVENTERGDAHVFINGNDETYVADNANHNGDLATNGADFAGIAPDANGVITFTLRPTGRNTAYLNVIEINAVPEPGSLGLMFSGAFLMLAARRRGDR